MAKIIVTLDDTVTKEQLETYVEAAKTLPGVVSAAVLDRYEMVKAVQAVFGYGGAVKVNP